MIPDDSDTATTAPVPFGRETAIQNCYDPVQWPAFSDWVLSGAIENAEESTRVLHARCGNQIAVRRGEAVEVCVMLEAVTWTAEDKAALIEELVSDGVQESKAIDDVTNERGLFHPKEFAYRWVFAFPDHSTAALASMRYAYCDRCRKPVEISLPEIMRTQALRIRF